MLGLAMRSWRSQRLGLQQTPQRQYAYARWRAERPCTTGTLPYCDASVFAPSETAAGLPQPAVILAALIKADRDDSEWSAAWPAFAAMLAAELGARCARAQRGHAACSRRAL
jgi:hypothetical protein